MFDDAYQVCGFLGGLMFPIATGFQTLKAIQTKSTEDISYGWQAIYALAETLYTIYAVHFQLWVLAIPLITELVLMTIMIAIKVYLENFYHTYVDGVKVPRPPAVQNNTIGEGGSDGRSGVGAVGAVGVNGIQQRKGEGGGGERGIEMGGA